jgi:hypothetical protein
MRKLRKTGAIDEHRKLVTIPRLPSVTGASHAVGTGGAPQKRLSISLGSVSTACRTTLRGPPMTSIPTG